MKKFLWLPVFIVPALAYAGVNTSSLAIAGEVGHSVPAASIVQRADYLCAIVVIRSSNRDVEKQTAAVQQSVNSLRTAAERSTHYQIHDGPVQSTGDLPQPGVINGVLQASARILSPLSNTNPAEIIAAIRQLRQFVASVDTAGAADLQISSISLAVEAPEQYRERLLDLITEQTRIVQRSLDARTVTVDGLGNGILVRQLDEMNVEIFFEHQISASLGR